MDEPLVENIIYGDTDSIRLLIEKYKYRAFSIAIGIVKNHQQAEEITQDSFYKALKKIESFKGKSKFSTWFFRIVINESLRQYKKKHLDTVELDSESSSNAYTLEENINDIEEVQKKNIINKILLQMPSKESTLLKLYYLEELSVKEIQGITRLSQSDIKVSLHRARKSFSKLAELNKNSDLKDYVR